MTKTYDENYPIVLGLAGKAGTGKTSVAEAIVPKVSINAEFDKIVWDHIFFALPLYEMVSIKKTIQGFSKRDRQLYALHSVVYDLFGGNPLANMPPYEKLIEIVQHIYQDQLPSDDTKPRSFLQKAGDVCRAVDPDCFAKWGVARSNSLHRQYLRSLGEDIAPLPFTVIISDVRFINEAEHILAQPNGVLICFDASDEVREQRLFERDGYRMSEEQKNHISEQQMDAVKAMATTVINTDELTVEAQKDLTVFEIYSMLGIYA